MRQLDAQHGRSVALTSTHTESVGPVERAAWLSEDVLLVVLESAEGRSRSSSEAVGLTVEARSGPRQRSLGEGIEGTVYAARLSPDRLRASSGQVAMNTGGETVVVERSALCEALTDLRALARERLAAWSSEDRHELLAEFASLTALASSPSLSEGLFTLREALRERQPLSVLDPGAERGVQVERLHRLDEYGFYVRGWWWETSPPVARFDAISPEGERVEIFGAALHHRRPDAAKHGALRDGDVRGFVSHFSTTAPSRRAEGWVVELTNATGRGVETPATLTADESGVEEEILHDLGVAGGDHKILLERHVRPALTQLRAARRKRVRPIAWNEYGARPSNPEVSIVVALDRRIELLEHQLAQFADDPDLHACELIYIARHPEDSERLPALARGFFELYGLPLRVATLSAAAVATEAANLGAADASAPRLLLLGPAVIPDRRGWLGRLMQFHEATPEIGALMPKLVYEDGLIDAAGLELAEDSRSGEWQVRSRYRGLERCLSSANVARPVAAGGPECMMLEARAFAELGGLSSDYLTSDYAGADLCLRLGEAGLESWYLPQVEVYRPEAGRGAPELEAARAHHDRWVLSRRHGTALAAADGVAARDALVGAPPS